MSVLKNINTPTKLSDKIDSKEKKVIEEKSCPIEKTSDLICDVLTENNDKLKLEDKICSIETPKKFFLKNDPETISKNKKSTTQKSSNVSNGSCINEIKKPRENYKSLNEPISNKFKGKEFDKKLLTIQDLIHYNPVTNPIVKEAKVEQKQDDDSSDNLLPIEPNQKPSVSNNCITPCIKIGVDGKIIIDQKTLTLNDTGLEEKREELAKAKVIEELGFNKKSHFSYRKREPYKQWTKEETLKFYKCLKNLGTDFSLIQQYFPNRTRDQIKRKYKTEEKKNLQLINDALTNNTHYNSVLLENMLKEDESEVTEVTKNQAKSEATAQPPTCKRCHQNVVRSECSQMSGCTYMMEGEIVLKNKSKIPIAEGKKRKRASLITGVTKKVETLSSKVCENKEEPIPKIRRLQEFHKEYEENITKYEGDSNSE